MNRLTSPSVHMARGGGLVPDRLGSDAFPFTIASVAKCSRHDTNRFDVMVIGDSGMPALSCAQTFYLASVIISMIAFSTSCATTAKAGESERAFSMADGFIMPIFVLPPSE